MSATSSPRLTRISLALAVLVAVALGLLQWSSRGRTIDEAKSVPLATTSRESRRPEPSLPEVATEDVEEAAEAISIDPAAASGTEQLPQELAPTIGIEEPGAPPSTPQSESHREMSKDVWLLGDVAGIELSPEVVAGLDFVVRWDDRSGTKLGRSRVDGTWYTIVRPGLVTIEVFTTLGERRLVASLDVDVRRCEGDPPYEVPTDVPRHWSFACERFFLPVVRVSVELLSVVPARGIQCSWLTGLVFLGDDKRGQSILPCGDDLLCLVTEATGEEHRVVVTAAGMADAVHSWSATPGVRRSRLELDTGTPATILVDPLAGARIDVTRGIMLVRKDAEDGGWVDGPTDGSDYRGQVRDSCFYPTSSGEVSIALGATDGTVGIAGVIGARTQTGSYRMLWRSRRVMPLGVQAGETAVFEAEEDLWKGWEE